MSVNVSVMRHGSESSMSLIRRFSKRVQGAGIVRKVKSVRYHSRNQSQNRRRTSALRRIAKREKNADLERLGLLKPRPLRGARR
jgi:ribosomal protein S21